MIKIYCLKINTFKRKYLTLQFWILTGLRVKLRNSAAAY